VRFAARPPAKLEEKSGQGFGSVPAVNKVEFVDQNCLIRCLFTELTSEGHE
jgi:hypothetical protein